MNAATQAMPTPFDLDNDHAYQAWRALRLEACPAGLEELIVEVRDPLDLSQAEYEALLARIRRANMAIYATTGPLGKGTDIPRAVGARFGLHRLDHNLGADDDAITALTVGAPKGGPEYVPYTNRRLHWHTDGYYNTLDRQVRGILLHCVRPALYGGANALLDHERVYILVRDREPAYIQALMRPDTMTIPANVVDGREIRPDRTGPVFMVMPDGRLHMRYTARARNVHWRDDPLTREAEAFLKKVMDSDRGCIYHGTLRAGWGLIANNVLHDRTEFKDDPESPRLIYRGRYYDRIANT